MTRTTAVVTTVGFWINVLRRSNRTRAGWEITEIKTILKRREPRTVVHMNFVITVRLCILVYIIRSHFVLLVVSVLTQVNKRHFSFKRLIDHMINNEIPITSMSYDSVIEDTRRRVAPQKLEAAPPAL